MEEGAADRREREGGTEEGSGERREGGRAMMEGGAECCLCHNHWKQIKVQSTKDERWETSYNIQNFRRYTLGVKQEIWKIEISSTRDDSRASDLLC